MRVLLVDDEPSTAYLLGQLLQQGAGFEVRTFENPKLALAAVPEFRPDAVCLDIGMPEMDGYELAAAIRQIPGLGQVPIVAVSGYKKNEVKFKLSGIDTYLMKPANCATVEKAILEAVKSRSRPAEPQGPEN